ncbi:redoxin family protein [Streptomyces sp. NBC_00191]|uniref:redoxin family protein n=1 Tax=Streptomyces sp. NBC_00191 TaxID=2975674 RepID=UPI00324E53A8
MRAGQAADVTVKALRYYEEIGLLEPARLPSGYRDYSAADVRLVIRSLMSLGLTPKETEPFLDCLRGGHEVGDDCPQSLAVYQAKIESLDALITQLMRRRADLAQQMHAAARRGFRSHLFDKEIPLMLPQADPFPENLPAPEDDGAADHLRGLKLPPLTFTDTNGMITRLDQVSGGRWVLYIYPLTGEPGADIPKGWDEIPGARGCSQEACSFRDNLAALQAQGAQRVLALSGDNAEYQQDLVRRLHLPYPMISDPQLSVAQKLNLPTFEANGATLYKRLTMIVRGDTIEHVFYSIFPPDTHATEVVEWLAANPVSST